MDTFYKTNKNYQRVLAEIRDARHISEHDKALVESFVERLLAERISHQRIKKYLTCLRNMAAIVRKDFASYGDAEFQRILASLNSRGLADWTVNDYKTTIKRFFRFILGDKYAPSRFAWIKFANRPANKYTITYSELLTPDEIQKLVDGATSQMYKALISLAYETGARPSELLTLQIADVATQDGYSRLSLRESKTYTRAVYAMDSDRYLKAWLQAHPFRQDSAALPQQCRELAE